MTSPAPETGPETGPEVHPAIGADAAPAAQASASSPRDTWADGPVPVATGSDPKARGRRGAFLRYRVMAWTTGTFLLVLVFVAVPLKYAAHNDGLMSIVGPGHGFLYMVYLVVAFDLARRVRWSLPQLLLLAVAGTIPFLSFVTEHRIARELYPDGVSHEAASSTR